MPDVPQSLEATGERLMPEAFAGELVLAEHVARYLLAARLAPGRRVLDAACGEGYGTAMLAGAGAARVVGVDVDEETVAHARRQYGLDARVGDVGELPFADGEFDLVVSFETIEHVPDPEQVLSEFARVLGDDGLLLVSTPNAREYLVDNPFHVRELTPEELIDALESRFAEVRPLYQQNFLTSAIFDAGTLALADREQRLDLESRKVAGVEPGRELYTLALCGPAGLPALPADVAVLSDVYEAHELAHRAAEAERILRDWHERATEAERLVGEWQARATEAERQTAELRATIERIAGSLSWRLTRPLRAMRGRSR
jgi:SAM-dependent methyltransferase